MNLDSTKTDPSLLLEKQVFLNILGLTIFKIR